MAALILLAATTVPPAGAQSPKPRGTIGVDLQVAAPALEHRPAMVSAIRDGRIVEQQEVLLGSGSTFRSDRITAGLYDVRVEGDGIVTQQKRGVHVFGGQQLNLIFQLSAGKGVHIVEYAVGALPREEVAARLAKLESQVAALEKLRSQK